MTDLDATYEPNWCNACGNIAVARAGTVCDICINEDNQIEEIA